MRAREFITENAQATAPEIATIVTSGRWDIAVTNHVLQRANERGIRPTELSTTLVKTNQAKAKIKQLVPGESFWLHDNTDNVSVCIIPRSQPGKMIVKTVLRGRPLVKPNQQVFEIR